MDETVIGVIAAVHLADEGTQQRWFELICQTYDQLVDSGEVEWVRFHGTPE